MSYPIDDRRPWLARARAQSTQVAYTRGRVVPPFRGAEPSPTPPRREVLRVAGLAWISVVLAVVAFASGAYAVIARVVSSRPRPTALLLPTESPTATARPIVTSPVVPTAVAAARAPSAKRAPSTSKTAAATPTFVPPQGPVKFEEGDADFILVPPRAVMPPLFDPHEYKQRRLAP